jgi:hypothetical protein
MLLPNFIIKKRLGVPNVRTKTQTSGVPNVRTKTQTSGVPNVRTKIQTSGVPNVRTKTQTSGVPNVRTKTQTQCFSGTTNFKYRRIRVFLVPIHVMAYRVWTDSRGRCQSFLCPFFTCQFPSRFSNSNYYAFLDKQSARVKADIRNFTTTFSRESNVASASNMKRIVASSHGYMKRSVEVGISLLPSPAFDISKRRQCNVFETQN